MRGGVCDLELLLHASRLACFKGLAWNDQSNSPTSFSSDINAVWQHVYPDEPLLPELLEELLPELPEDELDELPEAGDLLEGAIDQACRKLLG